MVLLDEINVGDKQSADMQQSFAVMVVGICWLLGPSFCFKDLIRSLRNFSKEDVRLDVCKCNILL